MAKDLLLIEGAFARGIVRDVPRHAEPQGGSYDLLDYLVDRPGMIYKRGGAAYQSAALSGETDLIGMAAPEYPGDARVIAFASDGSNTTAYDITTDTPGTGQDCESALILENPPLYVDRLIICDGRGTNPPKKGYLDSGTFVVADLTAGPPAAKYSCLHAGRLVLANSNDHPQRVWFGPALDIEPPRFTITAAAAGAALAGSFTVATPLTSDFLAGAPFTVENSTGNDGTYTAASISEDLLTIIPVEAVPDGTADGDLGLCWDTFNGYLDVDEEITGLASTQGVLLVFSRGQSQRVLGDIPPGYGVPSSEVNMALQPSVHVGCIDARSLVKDESWVYVANEIGVYAMNGAGQQSLTTKDDSAGVSFLWTDMIEGFAPALGSVVASGVYNSWLFVTVSRRANEEAAITGQRNTIAQYLPTGAWVRLSGGVGAFMYATRFAPFYEMYYALNDEAASDANRARRINDIFRPTSDNPSDPDGVDIEPLWETRTLGMQAGIGMKHYDLGHLTYLLDDSGGSDPVLLVTESVGLEAGGAFVAVTESPLPETNT